MTLLQLTYLVIIGLSALASGFFSGSETALIGIQKERVHQLAGSSKRGRRIRQLVDDPDRLLSTLLVANNLVNILGTAVATTLFIDLLGESWGPWISVIAVTTVILIVGEITPKTLAARHPERFSLAVAPTIWRLSSVLGPVARLFSAVTRALLRLFGVSPVATSRDVTEDDIRALSELGLAAGGIESVEHEILDALFTLADRPVKEVMTPRVDMATLEEPITIDAVREAIAATGHSRYPVSAGDLDDLSGVLYVKDLLQLDREPEPGQISGLLRAPIFVPESAPILRVLQDLRSLRSAFAIVLDEHGGVEGIVTIKDLVAELVGELQDEYDPGTPSVTKVGPSQWLADGRVPIEDLAEAVGVELPEGPYSTAAGLLMAAAGRIPDEGDQVGLDGLLFTVLQMDRNRIDRIQIETAS
jgi:CBS domain containing-hemolysin-like protein